MSSATGHSQTVPINLTNERFLRTGAGNADWDRVKVAYLAGDPRKQPSGSWQGFPAGDMLKTPHAHLNTYFSVGVQTGASRGLAEFEKLWAIVLDDAGTKADQVLAEQLLGTAPHYVFETSPGNCQVGWFIEPITDLAWALGLLRRLYEALGRQADNLKNAVGYMRLPVGTNHKAELGPGGFRVRVLHWSPDAPRIQHLDWVAIEQRIGLVVPAVIRMSRSHGMPDPGEIEADAVLQAFRLLDRVQGHGRMMTMGWGFDVDCPWIEEHSGRAREGTSYVPVRQRFHCHHGHCQDRNMGDVRVRLDELLRVPPPGGPGTTLAALEFETVDPQGVKPPWGWKGATGRAATRVLASYEQTEDGLTLAFADTHEGQLRFDHLKRKWFVWTGAFWRCDRVDHAFRWARQLAREFRKVQDVGVKALGKIAVAGAIERAARSDEKLAVDGLGWDQDLWRVGAPGCEIDLVAGTSELPDPAHGITRQLLVAPRDMPTPVWDQFIWDSTGGDVGLIELLQAWFGYCLTGDTSEEKFVFIFGPGGNGKSTFLVVFNEILGDYGVQTPAETFMQRKFEAHPAELARLVGARAVTASEIGEDCVFNMGRLKDLTGRSGAVASRFMRQDWFEYVPQFKLTIVGNNRPRLTEVGAAIQRRLILVPFTQIPSRVDTQLKDKLVEEYPGILRWAIEGENRRRALGGLAALIPASARLATQAYLDDHNMFKNWSEDRLEFGPGFRMTAMEGFEDYRTWCSNNNQHCAVGERQFRDKFLEAFPSCFPGRIKKGMVLTGVRLVL